jgi:hypothetical protein
MCLATSVRLTSSMRLAVSDSSSSDLGRGISLASLSTPNPETYHLLESHALDPLLGIYSAQLNDLEDCVIALPKSLIQ